MKILMSKNVSLELYKLCTQMQNIVYESMVSIVLGLMSKLGYVRILSSARFYLSLPLSSTIMPFPDWLSLGTPLCGCPSYHCRDTRWTVGKVLCLENQLSQHVNVGKAKIILNAHNAPKPTEAIKFPCGVWNEGIGSNSTKSFVCDFWVHKRCSNVKGHSKPNSILNVKSVKVKCQRRPFQTWTLLISMVKKWKSQSSWPQWFHWTTWQVFRCHNCQNKICMEEV